MTMPFTVRAGGVDLAVTAERGAVTAIRLNESGSRRAASPFEQMVERELHEYFDGTRTAFTFATRIHGTPFQEAVWTELRRIPYGETRTYGEIARALHKPHAFRAVGAANHANPLPIVIPCHRVVQSGGGLGGYGGGLALKRRLLNLETRLG